MDKIVTFVFCGKYSLNGKKRNNLSGYQTVTNIFITLARKFLAIAAIVLKI